MKTDTTEGWECKRRKMKCIFNPSYSAACNSCRRRGSKCVSQEFPEDEVFSPEQNLGGDDGVRLDASLNDQLPKHTSLRANSIMSDGDRGSTAVEALTPVSVDLREASPNFSILASSKIGKVYKRELPKTIEKYTYQDCSKLLTTHTNNEKLSHMLYEALPSPEEIKIICTAIPHASVLVHEILTQPYSVLDKTGLKTPPDLLKIPKPTQHPVLIARYMLQLAIFLQHLHPDLQKDIKGLSFSPRQLSEHLGQCAISLVTTNENLLGSIEGLECVMIEGMYQVNIGNLRRSWVAGRRAMGIAQLMGLNRSDSRTHYKVLDPETKSSPQFMWFRILFMDRHLSLMLGLAQGSLDCSIASETLLAGETPIGRLERVHCSVACRIIERNDTHMGLEDLSLTRVLDRELQNAAGYLPSKWWLVPTLDATTTGSQVLFWDTQRLFAQVLHYNLLNQLHLPYMLRSSTISEPKYEYSKITCVNASREVLSRFITLRSFNRIAYSCRIVDFLALMAAMTLLLAHLESHRSETDNALAHQFYSDRAMIEQAQDSMREINLLNSDALSAKSADLLRRLLAIEVDKTHGYSPFTAKVSVQNLENEVATETQESDSVVSVNIPYFGTIKIAREGVSKTSNPVETDTIASREDADNQRDNRNILNEPLLNFSGTHDAPEQTALRSVDDFDAFEYPELTAEGEDWAFQGVDMAFFDSLMRNSGDESNTGNEGILWSTD